MTENLNFDGIFHNIRQEHILLPITIKYKILYDPHRKGMTGSPLRWKNRESSDKLMVPTIASKSNDYIDYSYAKYLGGHPLHLQQTATSVYVYDNRIEIVDPELVIPYFAISRIENMDEKKISALRVVALGLVAFPLAIVGALWKKKHTYTVIQYKDEFDEKTLIIDFDADVYRIQPLIYNKMIESRRK